MAKILFPIIKPKLAFFQAYVERMFIHTTVSIQAGPGKAPETLDYVDMALPLTNSFYL
jgi:hypothetical protein